jgi:hypothetical protein
MMEALYEESLNRKQLGGGEEEENKINKIIIIIIIIDISAGLFNETISSKAYTAPNGRIGV